MKEITDIWFHTNLELDKLTENLGFDLEESDYENVWEWTISTFDDVKLDICRNHTEKRLKTFTQIFRIDEHKKPFSEKILSHIINKLKSMSIFPIYLGKAWIGKNDSFESEIIEVIE